MALRWDNPTSSVGIQAKVLARKAVGVYDHGNLSPSKEPYA